MNRKSGDAIRFGAVMENVIIKRDTREPDFSDGSLTENTRVVYPLKFIPAAIIPSVANHPNVIIFLTADAFGVMPPIAKLTKEGAMYHFMSGYTSKLAGTERGITEPKETFSQCFGAPFMPLHAREYAKMLGQKIAKHNTRVYLINTGWSGGPYGVGKRIDLKHTRAMVTSALNGDLEKTPLYIMTFSTWKSQLYVLEFHLKFSTHVTLGLIRKSMIFPPRDLQHYLSKTLKNSERHLKKFEMLAQKYEYSPEQIRTAVSRFLFLLDPEPEIPSPTWRLATRFGT